MQSNHKEYSIFQPFSTPYSKINPTFHHSLCMCKSFLIRDSLKYVQLHCFSYVLPFNWFDIISEICDTILPRGDGSWAVSYLGNCCSNLTTVLFFIEALRERYSDSRSSNTTPGHFLHFLFVVFSPTCRWPFARWLQTPLWHLRGWSGGMFWR